MLSNKSRAEKIREGHKKRLEENPERIKELKSIISKAQKKRWSDPDEAYYREQKTKIKKAITKRKKELAKQLNLSLDTLIPYTHYIFEDEENHYMICTEEERNHIILQEEIDEMYKETPEYIIKYSTFFTDGDEYIIKDIQKHFGIRLTNLFKLTTNRTKLLEDKQKEWEPILKAIKVKKYENKYIYRWKK